MRNTQELYLELLETHMLKLKKRAMISILLYSVHSCKYTMRRYLTCLMMHQLKIRLDSESDGPNRTSSKWKTFMSLNVNLSNKCWSFTNMGSRTEQSLLTASTKVPVALTASFPSLLSPLANQTLRKLQLAKCNSQILQALRSPPKQASIIPRNTIRKRRFRSIRACLHCARL